MQTATEAGMKHTVTKLIHAIKGTLLGWMIALVVSAVVSGLAGYWVTPILVEMLK